jgi:excisionase family DNA binding protein
MRHNHQQANGAQVMSPQRPGAGAAIPFGERLTCTIAEACAATGLGRTKLYELIGDGRVDTATIGRRRLVKVRSLQRLLAVGGEGVAGQTVERSDAVVSRDSCFEAAQNAAHASINRRRFSNKSPRR